MSVDYVPRGRIDYDKLLEIAGTSDVVKVVEATDPPHPISEAFVLFDGNDYVWARRSLGGNTHFSKYGMNNPEKILSWIEGVFGVSLASEYDDDYDGILDWGYPDEHVHIQLPTDDNPGPWRKVYPPSD